MNNHVVFFGAGQAIQSPSFWRRFSRTGQGEVAFSTYPGVGIDSGEDASVTEITDKVRQHLEKSSGMVLVIDPSGTNTKVHVYCKDAKSISAPSKALILTLAGQHRWEKLKNDIEFELSPWDSLIVPATNGLEKNLNAFVDSLNGLPDDYQASMLLNLVLPTFETRVARLEQILEVRRTLQQASIVREREKRDWEPISFWDLVISTGIVGLVLLIVVWFYLSATVVRDIATLSTQVSEIRTSLLGSTSGPDGAQAGGQGGERADADQTQTSLATLAVNPVSVAGREFPTGTATLTIRAPKGGASIMLSSDDDSVARVPAEVSVRAGEKSVTFTVRTSTVSESTSVKLKAEYGRSSKTATLTVNPVAISLATLMLSPMQVTGGNMSEGTVTLTSAAPNRGATIYLSSNKVVASVPTSVTVEAGTTRARFPIMTTSVTASTVATISAIFGENTKTIELTVSPRGGN